MSITRLLWCLSPRSCLCQHSFPNNQQIIDGPILDNDCHRLLGIFRPLVQLSVSPFVISSNLATGSWPRNVACGINQGLENPMWVVRCKLFPSIPIHLVLATYILLDNIWGPLPLVEHYSMSSTKATLMIIDWQRQVPVTRIGRLSCL